MTIEVRATDPTEYRAAVDTIVVALMDEPPFPPLVVGR